jgi:hypothetical protein
MKDVLLKMTESVKVALEDLEEDPSVDPAIATELEYLWGDLSWALRGAINGVWSQQCDNLVWRIVLLTRHTGQPTPWGDVSIELLESGVYQALHDAMGIPAPVDMQRVAKIREHIDEGLTP